MKFSHEVKCSVHLFLWKQQSIDEALAYITHFLSGGDKRTVFARYNLRYHLLLISHVPIKKSSTMTPNTEFISTFLCLLTKTVLAKHAFLIGRSVRVKEWMHMTGKKNIVEEVLTSNGKWKMYEKVHRLKYDIT